MISLRHPQPDRIARGIRGEAAMRQYTDEFGDRQGWRGYRPARGREALARGLGWFSLALGALEVMAPRQVTRPLGMAGHEPLCMTYGLREIVTGVGILTSHDPTPWLWGRVVGDALDLATVAAGGL